MMRENVSSDDVPEFGQQGDGKRAGRVRKFGTAVEIAEGKHENRSSVPHRMDWRSRPARLLPGCKLVACTAVGEDNARPFRVRLDFATQPGDQIVDAPIKNVRASAAHGIEQPIA